MSISSNKANQYRKELIERINAACEDKNMRAKDRELFHEAAKCIKRMQANLGIARSEERKVFLDDRRALIRDVEKAVWIMSCGKCGRYASSPSNHYNSFISGLHEDGWRHVQASLLGEVEGMALCPACSAPYKGNEREWLEVFERDL